ncbi:hypothetical protein ABZ793_25465 [Micromonospora sp. NPDC047465]
MKEYLLSIYQPGGEELVDPEFLAGVMRELATTLPIEVRPFQGED